MNDTPRADERGAALVTAMILLVVLGSLSTLILERSRAVANSTENERTQLRLFYAAEGGLAHAQHSLARADDHRGAELRIGTCDVQTEITELPGKPRRWQVSVEAHCPAAGGTTSRYRLEALMRPGRHLPVVEFRRRR